MWSGGSFRAARLSFGYKPLIWRGCWFHNVYSDSLKAGVMPTEECMACMEDVLRMFSEEAKQFRDNAPVQKARETIRG